MLKVQLEHDKDKKLEENIKLTKENKYTKLIQLIRFALKSNFNDFDILNHDHGRISKI